MDDSKALLQLITDSGAAHLQTLANAVVITLAWPGNARCRDVGSLIFFPAGQPPPHEYRSSFNHFKLTTSSRALIPVQNKYLPSWPRRMSLYGWKPPFALA